MKKNLFITLIFLALVSAVGTVQAQTQKGNLMVGAQLMNITGTFQKNNNAFDFGISPRLGYFVSDNIAVGGEVILNLHTAKGVSDFGYQVGPYGRYYFSDERIDLSKRSLFFVEANVGFRGENHKGGSSTNGLGIGFGPGLAYFITPNVGLDATLKYNLGLGFGNSTTVNSVGLNIGFQIYLPTHKAKELIREETGR